MDDPKYPASWQGEHFPGLSTGKMHLNGVTVPPMHAQAFPREVHPVDVIKADVAQTVIPAPIPGAHSGGNGAPVGAAGGPANGAANGASGAPGSKPGMVPTSTSNVWAP
jgi:hypothetical protein